MSFSENSYVFEQGDEDDFTFYLLDGKLEMHAREETSFNVSTTEERAKYPLAQIQPRKYSARALTPVKVLQINRNILEGIVAQEKNTDTEVDSEADKTEADESIDWMSLVLESSIFSKIPAANIQQLFIMLQPVNKRSGDIVIKQGDAGDYYYIIREGRCEVIRESEAGGEPEELAELDPGASFGEESLLSDKPRNATVTMLTDGILMQLSKENFIELIRKPILDSISFDDAKKIIEDGGIWLDVRSHDEYNNSNITNSINIPIFDIRRESDKLQINKKYIIYSNSNRRGAAAAFLLTELGFNVHYLENGIASIPETIREKIFFKKEETLAENERKYESKGGKGPPETTETGGYGEEKIDKPADFDVTAEQESVKNCRNLRKQLLEKIIKIFSRQLGNDEGNVEKELQEIKQVTEGLIMKERKSLELIHAHMQEELDNRKSNLEDESLKIQSTLKEIQTACDEAEITRKTAEEEVRLLKDQDALSGQEIKAAEQKHMQVQKKLIYAQQAEKTIMSAIEMNKQDILRHKEEEEKTRKQYEDELVKLSKEQEEYEKILQQI